MGRIRLQPNRSRLLKNVRPTPTSPISIIDACNDPNLFRTVFNDLRSWKRWFAFLKVVFNLPMTVEDFKIARICTQREQMPRQQPRDVFLVCGRRAGKSFITALIAVFIAVFIDWTPLLSPGERGTIIIVASDRKQARVIMRYIEALLNLAVFKPLVERRTNELVELRGQITIEIMTASFRSIRGYTVVAALLDEIAFWRSEDSSNPDTEILEAIRAGTSTIPGAMIMGLSSPYARRGVLWDAWKRYYGTDSDTVLVWQAPTWLMNPTVPLDIINEAYERDPFKADAEYGANFRRDVELFIPQEVVESCTDVGIFERAPDQYVEYTAFCDPSGGSQDSFTLAIAHHDEKTDKNVVDLVRSTSPPFSPEEVVKEYVKDMKRYNVAEVFSDRYGGDWVSERFLKQGVLCTPAKKSKSIIYREVLPMLNSGKVQLLDVPVVNSQLIALERKTRQGGNDLIDHPPGGHDDSINAVAGALVFIDQSLPIDMW